MAVLDATTFKASAIPAVKLRLVPEDISLGNLCLKEFLEEDNNVLFLP